MNEIVELLKSKFQGKSTDEQIIFLNEIKKELHNLSPFKLEPVDCVIWVKSEFVLANNYNPNNIAPPEMELLKHSIECDGFTQPVVTWNSDNYIEVVDGYHRSRLCKERGTINSKLNGYVPVVIINNDRTDRTDRIAATIRHNRARGKHQVKGMSEIVIELKRRNWSDGRIGHELGMDADEILRLTQITGLAEMFKDKEFSLAWEADIINENDNLNDSKGVVN